MAIDGQWDITVNTPMGPQKSTLTLKAEGDVLTGEQANQFGKFPLKDGKVDGDKIAWSVQITAPFPMTLKIEATIDGDAITGSVQTPMGSSPLSGGRAG